MKERKHLVYRVWFKVLFSLLLFVFPYTLLAYPPQDTSKVIAEILSDPLVVQYGWLLPLTKLLLFLVMLSPVLLPKRTERWILGYYSLVLVFVGIFQNMAHTSYGFSVSIGNLLSQLLLAGFVLDDLLKGKTILEKRDCDKGKLWVIPFMLLAFLLPYTAKDGLLDPSLEGIWTNEAGVTYCMITPVIIGLLLLFNKRVYKPSLYLISFLGLWFAIFNMLTWFVFDQPNWWMGVCHLPLLILSIYGMTQSGYRSYKKSQLS